MSSIVSRCRPTALIPDPWVQQAERDLKVSGIFVGSSCYVVKGDHGVSTLRVSDGDPALSICN